MIDFLGTRSHFRDHLRPVWGALPPAVRGRFLEKPERGPSELVLTAAYEDYRHARRLGYTRQAFIEHGIGQSYLGVKHGSYAGSPDRTDTELFLVPNEHSAQRWRDAYPEARVEIVGSPRLDDLPAREPGPGPVVALAFHWPCHLAPETEPAFLHFRPALAALAAHYQVLGHGHPRYIDQLSRQYRRFGIEVVRNFDEVCRRADVYVCDNSSTLYEFASTGRPVVVLNRPTYRRQTNHGLRFWDAADVGIQVNQPGELVEAVTEALRDAPARRMARESALSLVYARRAGAARLAAAAIASWAGVREAVAA